MIGVGVGVGSVPTCILGDLTGFVPPIVITVANGGTNPASSPLYAGQMLSQMTGYSSWIPTTNFDVSDPTDGVVSVDLQYLSGGGWINAAGSSFAEGDMVQMRVRVASNKGVLAFFPLANQTVQYRFRFTLALPRVIFDINTLVPDTETVIWTVADLVGNNAHLNDTYAMTAGAIRATAAVPGTARILYSGLLADLGVGDTVILHDGLFASATDSGSISRQLSRGATPLTTTISYTLTGSDPGNTLTLVSSLSDGVNPTRTATVTLDVPAVAAAIPYTFIGADEDPVNASQLFSGLTIGREYWVQLATRHGNVNRHIDGFTVDGGALIIPEFASTGVSAVRANEGNGLLVKCAWGKFTATAASHTLVCVSNSDALQSLVGCIGVDASVAPAFVEASADADALSTNIDVLANDLVFGIYVDDSAVDDDAPTGFSVQHASLSNTHFRARVVSHPVTSSEVAKTFGYSASAVAGKALSVVRLRKIA